MTNDEINIAIAKACGWKFIPEYCHGEDQPPEFTTVTPEGKHLCGYYPDYCNDLNAMHEAEKILLDRCCNDPQSDLWIEYLVNLVVAAPLYLREHATAAQRAEAFFRTLNLWEP